MAAGFIYVVRGNEASDGENMKATMNKIWNSQGRTIEINGERRTVESRRICYGGAIQLKLNRPLKDCTSHLFDVDPSNLYKVTFID